MNSGEGFTTECSYCKRTPDHLFRSNCPRDLHGSDDPFKSSCAWCESEIPSGAEREMDKFHNLYCDVHCKAEGLADLFERTVET